MGAASLHEIQKMCNQKQQDRQMILARLEKLVPHDSGAAHPSRYEHLRPLPLLTQYVRVGCFIKLMRLLETGRKRDNRPYRKV